jgi:hypothetical protein
MIPAFGFIAFSPESQGKECAKPDRLMQPFDPGPETARKSNSVDRIAALLRHVQRVEYIWPQIEKIFHGLT